MKQKAKQILGFLLMFMMVFSTITPAMAATTEAACSECGDHDGHDHADEQGCHQEDGHAECNDELCNVKHDNAAADHGTASTSSISKSLAQKQAACSHTWTTVVTKKATCGSSGTYVTKCSKCGAGNPNGNGYIPATGKHTWTVTSTKNATCTANGSKSYKCSVCGQTKTETINKLGHNYQQVITKNATCGTSGTYVSKCSRCGAGNANGNGTIPATGKHTWDRSAATCTAAKKCTVCGTVGEAAKGHKWNVSAATCTTDKKCTVCGTVSAKATGHTWNISAATCTTDKKCTKCGTVGQKALGHNYQQVITKDATCGAQGTYVSKCSRCGAGNANGNGYIPATGKHTWDRSAATCTAAKKCTVCGTVGEAAKGHTWDRSAATCTAAKKCKTCGTVGEAAKGHTWDRTAATCTAAKKCKTCGTVGEAAKGHTWDRSAATCTAAKKCTVCGTVGEAAKGHTWNVSAANCTTAKKCTVCGTVAEAAKGHTWNISAATCTTDKKCTTCGTVGQKALGHDYQEVITKQPTCGAQGIYETKCTRCGNGSQNGNGYIPATGKHTWNRTEATCTAAKKCTVCGTIGQQALGHDYQEVVTKQPTCGTQGTYETKCTRCGNGSQNGNGYIPATGKHTWDRTESTCTEDQVCTVCGKTGEPAKGHAWKLQKSVYGTNGYDTFKCTRCACTENKDHEYTWETVTEPYKCKPGEAEYKCKNCGHVKSGTTIQGYGEHTWVMIDHTNALCFHGTVTYQCSVCGLKKTEQYDGLEDHQWKLSKTEEPTLSKEGYEEYHCPNCYAIEKRPVKMTVTVNYKVSGDVVHTEKYYSGDDQKTLWALDSVPSGKSLMGWTLAGGQNFVYPVETTVAELLKGKNLTRNNTFTVNAYLEKDTNIENGDLRVITKSVYYNHPFNYDVIYLVGDDLAELWAEVDYYSPLVESDEEDTIYPGILLETMRECMYKQGAYRIQRVARMLAEENRNGIVAVAISMSPSYDGPEAGIYVDCYTSNVVPVHAYWAGSMTDWHSLYPNAGNMLRTAGLAGGTFFQVQGGTSYGADQTYFEGNKDFYHDLANRVDCPAILDLFIDSSNPGSYWKLNNGMCGPLAAVNTHLYLSTAGSPKVVTIDTVQDELLDFYDETDDIVDWTHRHFDGGDFYRSVKRYLQDCGYGVTVKELKANSLSEIKIMLNQGIPVIMDYTGAERLRMMGNINKLFTDAESFFDTHTGCTSHFFVVTGVYENIAGTQVYLEISSWGEKYYINWYEHLGKHGGFSDDNQFVVLTK